MLCFNTDAVQYFPKKLNTHPRARGRADSWLDWTTSFWRSFRKPISGGSPSKRFSSRSSTRSFLKFPMLEGIFCGSEQNAFIPSAIIQLRLPFHYAIWHFLSMWQRNTYIQIQTDRQRCKNLPWDNCWSRWELLNFANMIYHRGLCSADLCQDSIQPCSSRSQYLKTRDSKINFHCDIQHIIELEITKLSYILTRGK